MSESKMPKPKCYDYYFFKLKPGEIPTNELRSDSAFIGSAMHQDQRMLKHLGNKIVILGKNYRVEGWIVSTIKSVVHVFVSDTEENI